ncbi:YHYH protein [Microbulbifer variabilis]|uniref:YHYH protein n=1 Tax=Microbulbifer variabilis TaxID=266805 RepID=UPI001CFD3BB7|nr:YHYH protein [Microbulbifer variabilis]
MKIIGYFLAGFLAWTVVAEVAAQPSPNSGRNNDQRSVREIPVRGPVTRGTQNNTDSDNTETSDTEISDTSSTESGDDSAETLDETTNNSIENNTEIGEEPEDSSDTPTDSENSEGNAQDSADSESTWVLNSSGERAPFIYESSSNEQVLVNVQSVESVSLNGREYSHISATGIPNYQIEITQEILDSLLNRPKAYSDFLSGSPIIQVGDVIRFGEDIGYRSNSSCGSDAGYGFWPPGPVCPENVAHEGFIPNSPQAATEDCEAGLGVQGYWVNGTSIYQWSDGQSVNNTWHTLAPFAEVYDVDICGGHAANGDYHHHFYSSCLAELVGDDGNGHSPVYGYTADGYAIYGPWEDTGVLAQSSWAIRDYDNPNSASGCGETGARTCLLVDEYDIDQGVVSTNSSGPSTDGSYSSLSGNEFTTSAGFFYEDYYWDASLTARGGAYLDQYNGHSDSERGYHYHLTVSEDSNGKLIPAFPFTFGPRFYGKLDAQTIVNRCSTTVGQ